MLKLFKRKRRRPTLDEILRRADEVMSNTGGRATELNRGKNWIEIQPMTRHAAGNVLTLSGPTKEEVEEFTCNLIEKLSEVRGSFKISSDEEGRKPFTVYFTTVEIE